MNPISICNFLSDLDVESLQEILSCASDDLLLALNEASLNLCVDRGLIVRAEEGDDERSDHP